MRAEPRLPDTKDCPAASHEHHWRLGADRIIRYHATEHGVVSMTEEALTELLRLAGFTPDFNHPQEALR